MIVVTTTLTFGASLHTLVSQPALYGWNWDYAVQSSDGYGPVPNKAVATLRHDPEVTSSSGVSFATMQLDGVEVPTLLSDPGSPVAPPIIAGHGLSTKHQIVLGAATLAQLHKRIGDTVDLRYVPAYPRRPIRLTIVGVATMPAIGIAEGLHTSMGVGASVPADAGPVTESLGPQGYDPSCNGPNMVFLRVRGGQGAPQGLAAAERLSGGGEPHPGPARPQLDLRGERGHRAFRPAPRPDHQLPVHGHDPVAPGRRARPGRRRGPRAGPRGIGAAVPPGSGPPQGHGLRPTAAGRRGGVARLHHGHDRDRDRCPTRHRPRAVAVDPVRRRDRRGPGPDGPGVVGGRSPRPPPSCWRTLRPSSPAGEPPAPRPALVLNDE